MKILKIRIQNLNSLKEKQELIDFTIEPFRSAGLFAITGETGAGKTTILDAVTLAFYGKVPRDCNPKELMTHNTKESFAEVEFSANKKIYRAKWSLSKARTGTIKTPVRVLADISKHEEGEILHSGSKNFNQEIEEITGLDYQRFLRSVMLAQGEFAAFLKAKKKERGELLERITGTEEYSALSKKAYDKTKKERDILQNLKAKIDEEKLLTEVEKITHENNLIYYSETSQNLEKVQKNLDETLKWFQRIEELEKDQILLTEKQEKIEFQKQEFEPNLQKLKLHEKAFPFIFDYQILEKNKNLFQKKTTENQNIKSIISDFEKQISTHKIDLKPKKENEQKANEEKLNSVELINKIIALDEKIKSDENYLKSEKKKYNHTLSEKRNNTNLQIQKTKELTEKKVTFEKHEKWLLDNEKYQELDKKLPLAKSIFEQIQKLSTQQKNLKLNHSKNETEFQKLKLDKTKLESKQSESDLEFENLENELQKLEIEWENQVQNRTVHEFQTQLRELDQNLQIIQKLAEQSQLFEKSENELQKLILEFENIKIAKLETHNHLIINEKELNQAKEIFADKERIYVRGQKIKTYEEARKNLEKEEPCPLCGSEKHPFVENYEIDSDKEKQDYEYAKKTKQNIENELNKISKLLQKHETNFENLEQKINENKTKQSEITEKFKTLLQNSGFTFEILEKIKIETEVEVLKKSVKTENNLLENLIKLDKKISQLKEQKTTKIEAKNTLKSSVEKLIIQIQNSENETKKLELEIEKMKSEFSENQEKIESELRDFQEIIIESDWKKTFELLEKRSLDYQNYFAKKDLLKEEVLSLQNEVQNLNEKLKLQTSELAEKKAELVGKNGELENLKSERKTDFGDKNPQTEQKRLSEAVENAKKARELTEKILQNLETDNEKQKVLQSRLSQEIETLNQEIQDSEKQLLANIQKAGFVQFQDFKNVILENSQVEKWQKEWNNLNTETVKIEQSIQDLAKNLAKEKAKSLTEKSPEEIDFELVTSKKEAERFQQKIGELRQVLKQDKETKNRFAEITSEIEKQEKIYQRWADLSDVIGSAQGDKFRVFAQGLTLNKLILLANRYLERLNVRYLIRQSKTEELELEILDTYQADNIRSMNTLSGGESFLVSLALALGLSDLASRKAKISSLFIDEGFGTLDSQTLETAVSTLETLQSTGKTIGVISHVQALKDRISTQIQVEKMAGGVSKIQIIS